MSKIITIGLIVLALVGCNAKPAPVVPNTGLAGVIWAVAINPTGDTPAPDNTPSEVCEHCGGDGIIGDGRVEMTCPTCGGSGTATSRAEASGKTGDAASSADTTKRHAQETLIFVIPDEEPATTEEDLSIKEELPVISRTEPDDKSHVQPVVAPKELRVYTRDDCEPCDNFTRDSKKDKRLKAVLACYKLKYITDRRAAVPRFEVNGVAPFIGYSRRAEHFENFLDWLIANKPKGLPCETLSH